MRIFVPPKKIVVANSLFPLCGLPVRNCLHFMAGPIALDDRSTATNNLGWCEFSVDSSSQNCPETWRVDRGQIPAQSSGQAAPQKDTRIPNWICLAPSAVVT